MNRAAAGLLRLLFGLLRFGGSLVALCGGFTEQNRGALHLAPVAGEGAEAQRHQHRDQTEHNSDGPGDIFDIG